MAHRFIKSYAVAITGSREPGTGNREPSEPLELLEPFEPLNPPVVNSMNAAD
jgi:hypothetical protein